MKNKIIFLSILIIFSCSKEKKVHNIFLKNKGIWGIRYYIKQTWINDNLVNNYGRENAGTFRFNKETVEITEPNINGDSQISYIANWDNNQNALIINSDDVLKTFDINDFEKGEVTLKYTNNYFIDGDNYKIYFTYFLKQ